MWLLFLCKHGARESRYAPRSTARLENISASAQSSSVVHKENAAHKRTTVECSCTLLRSVDGGGTRGELSFPKTGLLPQHPKLSTLSDNFNSRIIARASPRATRLCVRGATQLATPLSDSTRPVHRRRCVCANRPTTISYQPSTTAKNNRESQRMLLP